VPTPSKSDERLARRETIRRSADYLLCYRRGKRQHGSLVALHLLANPHEHPRLGITVSRKVGGAVVRNRLKRWTRETFRRWPRRAELAGLDLLVHFKPPAGAADHAALTRELHRLFAQTARRSAA
jgi:ribonuclease P protein component